MEASALVKSFRSRVDDLESPYLTSDALVLDWAAEAETEAATRARLLKDNSSTMTQIAVLSGQRTYKADQRIFEVCSALWNGQGTPLQVIHPSHFETQMPRWRDHESSKPTAIMFENNTITIYPKPTQAGTLNLEVYRTPIYDIEELDDEFEIQSMHQRRLIDWVLYRYYSQEDVEVRDEEKAMVSLARFEDSFGMKYSADSMRKQSQRRRHTTRRILC